MPFFIKNNVILLLCIAGSIVRLIYGFIYEPWTEAPDHIAWELTLEQSNFRYDHLIHYPHEGGTILISLLAKAISFFTSFSSLTILAILLDFTVRFIQITVVQRVFNLKSAILFGIWTVFATPAILPWGTLNFGLHYISSVFPFILLLLLSNKEETRQQFFYIGLFLGIAIWFSYSNLILLPVFILYLLIRRPLFKRWIIALLSLSSVLLLHIIVRLFADPGFHLSEIDVTSIRGLNFSISANEVISRLQRIPEVAANAANSLPTSNEHIAYYNIAYYSLFVLSLIGLFLSWRKRQNQPFIFYSFCIILLFLTAFVIGPFYHLQNSGNHVLFRHSTYILPMLALLIIVCLSSFKFSLYVQIAFIAIGISRSAQLFNSENTSYTEISNQASGWVLATKLGHDQKALISIVNDNPKIQSSLIQGIGWGSCTSLFQGLEPESRNKREKIRALVKLCNNYPDSFQKDLLEGIKFAFNPDLLPKLNKELLPEIETAIQE